MARSLQELVAIYNGTHDDFAKKYKGELCKGQEPQVMTIECVDSRLHLASIIHAELGEILSHRTIANIVPSYESGRGFATGAFLEFGTCYLNIPDLVICGHSQCGGINGYLNPESLAEQDDFISRWVGNLDGVEVCDNKEEVTKRALVQSYENVMTYPWIRDRVERGELGVHLWYFVVEKALLECYSADKGAFVPLG